jgi:hypothetical protein
VHSLKEHIGLIADLMIDHKLLKGLFHLLELEVSAWKHN